VADGKKPVESFYIADNFTEVDENTTVIKGPEYTWSNLFILENWPSTNMPTIIENLKKVNFVKDYKKFDFKVIVETNSSTGEEQIGLPDTVVDGKT